MKRCFRCLPLLSTALALVFSASAGIAAPSKPASAVKNDFAIPKTTAAYHIDGVLDEPFWKESGVLETPLNASRRTPRPNHGEVAIPTPRYRGVCLDEPVWRMARS